MPDWPLFWTFVKAISLCPEIGQVIVLTGGASEGLHLFLLLSGDLFTAGARQIRSCKGKGARLDGMEVFLWWWSVPSTNFPSHQMCRQQQSPLSLPSSSVQVEGAGLGSQSPTAVSFKNGSLGKRNSSLDTLQKCTFFLISPLHFGKTVSRRKDNFISSYLCFW